MSADEKKKNDQADETGSAAGSDTNTDGDTPSSSVPDSDMDRAVEPAAETERADAVTETSPPEAAKVVQEASARSDGFARFVAVLALIVAVAVMALSQFPQVPKGSAAKLAAVESRLGELNEPPSSSAGEDVGPAVAEMASRLAAAEERLANLSLLIDEMRTAQEKFALEAEGEAGNAVDTSEIDSRIAELSAQVEELANRPDPAPASVTEQSSASPDGGGTAKVEAELSALQAELAALKSEIARVEGGQADISRAIGDGDENVRQELRAAIDAASSSLGAQIEGVEAAARQNSAAASSQVADKAAMVLAAARLKDAASGSAPFTGAWQAVESLGVTGDHVAISDAAATGVPTLIDLKASFADEASKAIVADKVGEGDGWVDGALKRVGSLVKVRRTGELEGDAVEAIVARAEVRLADDNLAGAVEQLEALQGAAFTEMTAWMNDARRRLALNAAVDALQSSMLAGLGGSN